MSNHTLTIERRVFPSSELVPCGNSEVFEGIASGTPITLEALSPFFLPPGSATPRWYEFRFWDLSGLLSFHTSHPVKMPAADLTVIAWYMLASWPPGVGQGITALHYSLTQRKPLLDGSPLEDVDPPGPWVAGATEVASSYAHDTRLRALDQHLGENFHGWFAPGFLIIPLPPAEPLGPRDVLVPAGPGGIYLAEYASARANFSWPEERIRPVGPIIPEVELLRRRLHQLRQEHPALAREIGEIERQYELIRAWLGLLPGG